MAIVGTSKDTGSNDTPGAGPQATASVAFQNNTLYLLTVTSRGITADSTAVSGGGLTWTRKVLGNNVEVWEGFTATGAITGALSISWGGTSTAILWAIDEFTGVDTTTRIVQAPVQSSGTGTTGSGTTMAAFGDAVNNAAFLFAQHNANETSTAEAGYTALANFSGATTPVNGHFTEYKVGEDTIPTATWATSAAWKVDVLEIKAATGTTFTISLAGAITPAGVIAKVEAKPVVGAVTPAGSVAKLDAKLLAGSATPTGALSRLFLSKQGGFGTGKLSGAITPAGALTKLGSKRLVSSLSPDQVDGLRFWVKADAITGLADAAAVASWVDSSGGGWTLAQAAGTAQPTYRTNVLNGKPVVRFDGDDRLFNTAFSQVQPGTVFIVGKQTAVNASVQNYIDGSHTGPSNTGRWALGAIDAVDYRLSDATNNFVGGQPDTAFHAFSAVVNGAGSQVWFDGTSIITGSFNSQPLTGLTLGSDLVGSTQFLTGDIAEVIIYNRALTDQERRQLEAGLSEKYAIRVASSGGGTIAPSGALAREARKTFTGSVAPSGVVAAVKVVVRSFAGAITPTGALSRLVQKVLTGALTPSGVLQRETRKTLLGALTPAGAVALVRSTIRSFAGTITPVGVVQRETRKAVAGGSTPSGVLVRALARALSGSLTPSGVLSRRVDKPTGGQVASSGGISKEVRRTLSGQVAPAGLLTKSLARVLAGAMTPAGILTRQTRKAHGGALAPSGVLFRSVAKSLGGTIQPVGSIVREIRRALGGSLAPTGTVGLSMRFVLLSVGVAVRKWMSAAASLKWSRGTGERKWDSDDAR